MATPRGVGMVLPVEASTAFQLVFVWRGQLYPSHAWYTT